VRPLLVDLGREYRGGQHQALLLLQGLRERGHTPELIAVQDSILASRAKDAGFVVHVVDSTSRRFASAWKIRSLVRGRRVDLVHANEPHALTAAWLARAHRHTPLVVSRRLTLPLSSGYFSQMRYRAAARIIAVSHCVEQAVIQSGLPTGRALVIYDGVEIPSGISQAERRDARNLLGIPQQACCIGNVAAFTQEKGHALLLEAFARVHTPFPGCLLLLRGDGPDLPKVRELARQLGLLDAVKFLPTTIGLGAAFAAMDIFAFPSREEALGTALLAAMAHSLPVAATARGGIPEVVNDGKNGLLVEDYEPEKFAAALSRLLTQSEEASRLGNAARETIAARFSAHRMIDGTLHLYESLVSLDV
jgi:glycosyltransferase involved in cell wall biosynthesis